MEKAVFLETDRLILRKYEEADFPDYCGYIIDPERNRMMGNDDIPDAAAARESFDWLMANEDRFYVMVLKETGRGIGDLTVCRSTPDVLGMAELAGKKGAALSFSIARPYRRRGLMFEAVSAVIDHLFRVEGLDYINSGYLDFNLPSRELHKKLGFSYLRTDRYRREEGGEELVAVETILWRK